jgi:hypothetical protein
MKNLHRVRHGRILLGRHFDVQILKKVKQCRRQRHKYYYCPLTVNGYCGAGEISPDHVKKVIVFHRCIVACTCTVDGCAFRYSKAPATDFRKKR